MDREDEEFAHGADGTIAASPYKNARRGRIPSYCEFATHSLVSDPARGLSMNSPLTGSRREPSSAGTDSVCADGV